MVRIDSRKSTRRRLAVTAGQCATALTVVVLASFTLSFYYVSSLEGTRSTAVGGPPPRTKVGAPAAEYEDSQKRLSDQREYPGDTCEADYRRANRDRTPGLTAESIARSRAWIGNRERLDNVARNLTSGRRDVHFVIFGGSITLGHGVARNATPGFESQPYGDLLERWLNDVYGGPRRRHRVFNMAAHGADVCALEKRINGMLSDLEKKNAHPDLFTLEFAVNDYQGQDHVLHAVSKTDVFFDGFQDIALCAEVVVNKLLRTYPRAAVLFLEFRTGILNRRTAAFLHSGVAQHYEVPVISYAEAMFPEYFRLISLLNASDRYTVPEGETLLPYPYGCHPCQPHGISKSFRHFRPPGKNCRTICDLMDYGGNQCDQFKVPPAGRNYCHPAIFAVDAVHPSTLGHRIAKDLIAHTLSSAVRDRCKNEPFAKHVLPATGWLGTPKSLATRSDWVLVNDTDCALPFCESLTPSYHTPGFSFYSDVQSKDFVKNGWIATSSTGNETIEFDIDLPQRPCYVVYVAVLRSYRGMGKFEIAVQDMRTNRVTQMDSDGLWGAHISVWSDTRVTKDNDPACTGRCKVRINTKPQIPDRDGNKVKILTLSARKCSLEN